MVQSLIALHQLHNLSSAHKCPSAVSMVNQRLCIFLLHYVCASVCIHVCTCAYVIMYVLIQTTVLALLDTMIQPLEGEPNTYIVYYHILDGDQHGRAPNCRTFDSSEKSCLHKIAKSNNKVFTICTALLHLIP